MYKGLFRSESRLPNAFTFAKENSFDVHAMVCQLQNKQQLSIMKFDAEHGFLDFYSKHYNLQQAKHSEESITCSLNECIK
jgi:hypothetical protein